MNIRIARAHRLWFVKPFPTNFKKRTLRQKIRAWRKSLRKTHYKVGGQIALL